MRLPALSSSLRWTTGSAPKLAEVLDEVEGERVVVVDHQHPVHESTLTPAATLSPMPESKTRKKKGARPQQPYRATPSVKKKPPSPTWYVVTMFGLMGIGVLAVVARYVFQLDYLVLIGGLVALAAGFLMTTNYR